MNLLSLWAIFFIFQIMLYVLIFGLYFFLYIYLNLSFDKVCMYVCLVLKWIHMWSIHCVIVQYVGSRVFFSFSRFFNCFWVSLTAAVEVYYYLVRIVQERDWFSVQCCWWTGLVFSVADGRLLNPVKQGDPLFFAKVKRWSNQLYHCRAGERDAYDPRKGKLVIIDTEIFLFVLKLFP